MKRAATILTLTLLVASAAHGGGFQVAAQGSRAMGMGLAYTAVAGDATAIYYNPAGLALQRDGEIIFGAMWATKTEASFTPSAGPGEEGRIGNDILPQLYVSHPFGTRIVAGVGVYAPFGLPVKWEPSFSGRSISYTALLKTLNVNPSVALRLSDHLMIGVGGDYMFSKVQLQRSLWFGGPEAQTKLTGDLFDNHGIGWNAGVLWTSGPLRLGAAYRSAIDVDHDVTINAYSSGVPAIDAAVALNTGAAMVDIEFPSSLNLGAAYTFGTTTIAVDLDRTHWSSFEKLQVFRGATPVLTRNTNWDDAWAYRLGIEKKLGPIVWRAGVYRDQTPQPAADVGPILPDADRNGYTIGVSIGAPGGLIPSIDVADVYVRFADRNAAAVPTVLPPPAGALGMQPGRYATTGNELSLNAHWKW